MRVFDDFADALVVVTRPRRSDQFTSDGAATVRGQSVADAGYHHRSGDRGATVEVPLPGTGASDSTGERFAREICGPPYTHRIASEAPQHDPVSWRASDAALASSDEPS